MKLSAPHPAAPLAMLAGTLALAGTLVLGGCGGSKATTVSVSGSTAPTASSSPVGQGAAHQTTKPTTIAPPGASTSTAPLVSPHASASPQRKAPAPAFTEQQSGVEGLGAAVGVLAAHGFTAANTATYSSQQTLRVLIGTRKGSGEGSEQQAFFFEGGHYLGTDTAQPSASVRVIGQSDTEVTLAYPLYRPHDPPCCPKGGEATVRYQLDNGRLQALDPIPPASSSSGPSRQ